MTHEVRVPWFVRIVDPLARRLLRWGIPMGPDRMLTIRGRTSGRPREAAVAVVQVDERRWVVGAYGNVNWVRNLRAAGEATLHERHGPVRVQAIELSFEEAADFFGKPFRSFAEGLPWAARVWVPGKALEDPDGAVRSFPVFELIPTD